MNAKERRVVVVESILLPSRFRQMIARVLFEHFEVKFSSHSLLFINFGRMLFYSQVPSILFAPSHLTSVFTVGVPSCLVLDVGYKAATVLPVRNLIKSH